MLPAPRQVLAIISAEYPALAHSYAPEPTPDPGTASLPDHGDAVGLGQPHRAVMPAVAQIHDAQWSHPCAPLHHAFAGHYSYR